LVLLVYEESIPSEEEQPSVEEIIEDNTIN
jgi:hypothetical protein